MLAACGSSALAAVVDENGTRGIQIDLNMTNQRFQLSGIAPRDDNGMYLVNGFKVFPPKDEDEEYYLTDNILTNVANAMYIREKWPSLKKKYFNISDNHCYFGKGTNIIDFTQAYPYKYNGERLLLPAVHKSDLSDYTFEVEGKGNELALKVTKVIERSIGVSMLMDTVPPDPH